MNKFDTLSMILLKYMVYAHPPVINILQLVQQVNAIKNKNRLILSIKRLIAQ